MNRHEFFDTLRADPSILATLSDADKESVLRDVVESLDYKKAYGDDRSTLTFLCDGDNVDVVRMGSRPVEEPKDFFSGLRNLRNATPARTPDAEYILIALDKLLSEHQARHDIGAAKMPVVAVIYAHSGISSRYDLSGIKIVLDVDGGEVKYSRHYDSRLRPQDIKAAAEEIMQSITDSHDRFLIGKTIIGDAAL